VSNWANSIEGFEWSRRREFAAAIDDAPGGDATPDDGTPREPGGAAAADATDGTLARGAVADEVASDGGRADPGAAAAGTGTTSPSTSPSPTANADPEAGEADRPDGPTTGTDRSRSLRADVAALSERVTTLEDRLRAAGAGTDEAGSGTEPEPGGDGGDRACGRPFEDEELAAKVVRACLADDAISEEEEVRILGRLLR
jgi:hypothetical protein